jgi:hypothetical protein
MGPTNDHELAIARIVDKLSIDGKLYPAAIENVITVLDFAMSKSDGEFLVRISMAYVSSHSQVTRNPLSGPVLSLKTWV